MRKQNMKVIGQRPGQSEYLGSLKVILSFDSVSLLIIHMLASSDTAIGIVYRVN